MKKTFYVEHEGKIIGTRKTDRDYKFAVIVKYDGPNWWVRAYRSTMELAEKAASQERGFSGWSEIKIVPVLAK